MKLVPMIIMAAQTASKIQSIPQLNPLYSVLSKRISKAIITCYCFLFFLCSALSLITVNRTNSVAEWGVLFNCAIKWGSQQSGGRDESSRHLLHGAEVRRRRNDGVRRKRGDSDAEQRERRDGEVKGEMMKKRLLRGANSEREAKYWN